MNSKVSHYDLSSIIRDTPKELKGKKLKATIDSRSTLQVGRYQKRGANWLYFIYAVVYPDRYNDIILIATIGDIIQ